jgi:hypothetical protein
MKNNKLRNILLLIALALAASAPLFCSGLFLPSPGHDLQFHLQRIAGLAQALAAGRFPVQIDPWWIKDTGYAVSVFYPDLFLLPSALLVNWGLPLELSYKLLLAAVNIVSCFLAFRSFRRIFQKESLAWLGTILFILAPYRLTDLYLRNALGENLAMMFLPLAAESLYTIYHADGSDAWAWRRMGLAYAGICLSHPLSLFMAGLFTLIYVLLQGRKTGQKLVWTALLKGTGLAILLSLWFLAPLIRFSSSNRLLMDTMYRDVYQEAVYEWQLLEFFSPVRGPSMHLTEGTAGEMPFYLGWSLLIGLIVLIILLARKKAVGRTVWQIVLMSLLSMWMCTRLFPYDQLQKNPVTDYFVTKIQYPWRFEMEATLVPGSGGHGRRFLPAGQNPESVQRRRDLPGGAAGRTASFQPDCRRFRHSCAKRGRSGFHKLYGRRISAGGLSERLPVRGSAAGIYWSRDFLLAERRTDNYHQHGQLHRRNADAGSAADLLCAVLRNGR